MKKLIIILIFFLFIFLLPKESKSKMVMNNIDNNSNHYELVFDNDYLCIRNFKLKLSIFSNPEHVITKIYFYDLENIKEYFSFDNSNFNIGIEKLKDEYNLLLKNNYLYNELDKDIDDAQIKRVELYTSIDALTKFKNKYPLVKVKNIR